MSARPRPPVPSSTRSFLAQCPNLPPQQSSDHQVEIGGQIRLACASGCRMRAQYEQATPGERGKSPAHQFPEPPFHPVANHRRANRTADDKAYLRRITGAYPSEPSRQAAASGPRSRSRLPGDPSAARAGNPPAVSSSTAAAAQHLLCSPGGQNSATSAAPLPAPVRRSAARGPYDGARREQPCHHGCACAAGNHGPSPADGCSAGTYACSLDAPDAVQGSVTDSKGSAC